MKNILKIGRNKPIVFGMDARNLFPLDSHRPTQVAQENGRLLEWGPSSQEGPHSSQESPRTPDF